VNDPEERAADRVADQALHGGGGEVASSGGLPVLRREPDDPEAEAAEADDPWGPHYTTSVSPGPGCHSELIEGYCPLDPTKSAIHAQNADSQMEAYIQADCDVIHEPDTAAARSEAQRRLLLAIGDLWPDWPDEAAAQAGRADIRKKAQTEEATLAELGAEVLTDTPEAFPMTAARIHRERNMLRVDFAAIQREQADAQAAMEDAGKRMGDRLPSEGMPDAGTPPLPFAAQVGWDLGWPLYLKDAGVVGNVARAAWRYRALGAPTRYARFHNRRVEDEAGSIELGEMCPTPSTLEQAALGPLPLFGLTSFDPWGTLRDAIAETGDGWSGLSGAGATAVMGWYQLNLSPEDHAGAAVHWAAIKAADATIAGMSRVDRLFHAIDIAWYRGYFGKAADEVIEALKENWELLLAAAGVTVIAIAVATAVPIVGWALGAIGLWGVATAVIDIADSILDCMQATTVRDLQQAAKRLARTAVTMGVEAIIGAALGAAGKRVVKTARRVKPTAPAGAAKPDVPPQRPRATKPPKDEPAPTARRPKPTTVERVAEKFEEFAAACSLGSIKCRFKIPDHIVREAGPYPTQMNVPMPKGPFTVQKAALTGAVRVSTTLQQTVLTDPKRWPHFEAALKASKGKWPEDPPGVKWQVHHIKPVFMGGESDIDNLIPLPAGIHQEYTTWWNRIHRGFRTRFDETEWDLIYYNQQDVPGSRVPLTKVR
jgi:hypothetical protein